MGACSAWYCPAGKGGEVNIRFGGASRTCEVRAAGTVGTWPQAVGCPKLCQRLFATQLCWFQTFAERYWLEK